MNKEDFGTDSSVNIKLSILDGLFTCSVSAPAAHIQRKQTAGDIRLRIGFTPVSAKDQRRRENSCSGKEHHH